jgi:predicted DNA-binding protein
MSTKTKLDRLAEHYDTADTAEELEGAERMTTFAVRLPVVVLDHIREVAEHHSVTTSALIRRWIEAGIAEDGSAVGDRVVSVQALLELIGRAPRENADR